MKFGGDHGGGSFKFLMQIGNVAHPNSIRNTIPISVFDCPDTAANLQTALSMFTNQISELQTATWREHSFVISFFGDYEFETKLYGISGASGVHPCLYCVCIKKNRARPKAEWAKCRKKSAVSG